ncbi:chromosomal replication initiator protein DnaA [Patescibacteria group bacterium]
MDPQKTWQATLGELELSISKANFTTWFRNTFIMEWNDEEVVIGVPNAFTKEWLENKYHKEIFRSINSVVNGTVRRVRYEIGSLRNAEQHANVLVSAQENQMGDSYNSSDSESSTTQPFGNVSIETTMPGVDRNTNLNPRFTFDDYVVGPSNELAQAAAQSVSLSPGTTYNPLFMYGAVGIGKTHLMHAIGNEIVKNFPERNILYVTSEAFTNDFVESVRNKTMASFKERFRNLDLLIVDDIQFLSTKEQTREEFFHTFNAITSHGGQIVISSDQPPKSIPTIEDRLRSRFEGGMIVDIGIPELETRLAILNKKVAESELEFPDDVLEYVAQNVRQSVRELEGVLNRIIATSQLKGIPPALEDAKNVLATVAASPKKRAISPKRILEIVSQFYDVDVDVIKGKCRKKEIVRPRQISMYLMREESHTSYPTIGQELGNKDHTTAMHAVDKITRNLEEDEELRQEIDLIRQRLYLP